MDHYISVTQKDGYDLVHTINNKDTFYELHKVFVYEPEELDLYQKRRQEPNPYHPKVIQFQTKYIQGNNTPYYIIILQQVVLRLSDIKFNISQYIQKSLFLLVAQTIVGFSSLYKQFGPFKIRNNLMGLDINGHMKVWVNTNFAKNDINIFYKSILHTEETMLKNITDIFETYGYRNEQLNKIVNFEQALEYLQNNIKDNQLHKQIETAKKQKFIQRKKKMSADSPTLTPKCRSGNQVYFYQFIKSNNQQNKLIQQFLPDISDQQRSTVDNSPNKNLAFLPQPEALCQSTKKYSASDDDCLIIRREVSIPVFIDEDYVKQYLSNSTLQCQDKINYIDYLLLNSETNQKVKQLANIFKFAIMKDVDLYKILLKNNGKIESLAEQQFQKIQKIKQNKYRSNSISMRYLNKFQDESQKIKQSNNTNSLLENSCKLRGLIQSNKSIQGVSSKLSCKDVKLHTPYNINIIKPQTHHRVNLSLISHKAKINSSKCDQFIVSSSKNADFNCKLNQSNLTYQDIKRQKMALNTNYNQKSYALISKKSIGQSANFRDKVLFKYNINH